MERVVEIRRQAEDGSQDAQVAADLHELARLLGAKGDFEGAAAKIDESIRIKQRVMGDEAQENISRSLHELAGMDMAMGQLPAAKEKLNKAISLEIEAAGSEAHPKVIASLKEASRVFQAMGDMEGAQALMLRARDAEVSFHGDSPNSDMADTLVQLAGLMTAAGELAVGKAHLEEALAIRASLGIEVEPEEQATILLSLAGVHQALGEMAECRTRLEEALVLQRGIYDEPHAPEISNTINLLAGTVKALGDSAAAEAGFRELIVNRLAEHGTKTHLEVAVAEANLAQVLMETERQDEAQPLLEGAYAVFLELAGPTHPITQQLARLVPGSDTSQVEKNPALAFVLQVFAALDGAPVNVPRLRRLAWRVMLRQNAGPFLGMLLMADIQSLTPGSLGEDPSSVPAPATAPQSVQTMWPGLIMELAQAYVRFRYDFDHLVDSLPVDADGYVAAPLGVDLPDDAMGGKAAIVDEARAELVGAERRNAWPDGPSEMPVWARAAEITLEVDPEKDGAEMAKRILGICPEFRPALMTRWDSHLSKAHRQVLASVIARA